MTDYRRPADLARRMAARRAAQKDRRPSFRRETFALPREAAPHAGRGKPRPDLSPITHAGPGKPHPYFSPIRYRQPFEPIRAEWTVCAGTSKRSPTL